MDTPYSPKRQHCWDLTIRLFSVISRILIGGEVLPICRSAVSVFCSLSRLGNLLFWTKQPDFCYIFVVMHQTFLWINFFQIQITCVLFIGEFNKCDVIPHVKCVLRCFSKNIFFVSTELLNFDSKYSFCLFKHPIYVLCVCMWICNLTQTLNGQHQRF